MEETKTVIRTQPGASWLELSHTESESPNPLTWGLSQEGMGGSLGLGAKGPESTPQLYLLVAM